MCENLDKYGVLNDVDKKYNKLIYNNTIILLKFYIKMAKIHHSPIYFELHA